MIIRKRLKIKYLTLCLSIMVMGLIVKKIFFSASVQPNYISVAVTRGDIEHTVLADGTIKAFKQVSVGAQVSGQIKKLYVSPGQVVKKGELVAEIDDLTQKNKVKQTEASLKSLQAQRAAKVALFKNYQLTYQRQQKLMNKKVGVQADLDLAKSNLESITADIEALDSDIISAQIAVDTAKLDLGYTQIKSPIAGIIVAIPVEEGQTVNSVQSAPTIVKIAQLDKMTIEAKISEADVIKVKKGMPVYFSIIGEPNHFYRGLTLRDIKPAPDSINADNDTLSLNSNASTSAIYYNGLFDVDNPAGLLRISMTAQVYIVLASKKDVLLAPTSAINFDPVDPEQGTVNVLNQQGEPTERAVSIGINNAMISEIKAGVNAGDKVIVNSVNNVEIPNKIRRRVRG